MDQEKHQNTPETDAAVPPPKNKKKAGKGRWSALDTVILVLVLIAVVGIAARVVIAYLDDHRRVEGKAYEVYFTVDNVYATVLDELNARDPVYLYDSDDAIGYIMNYADGSIVIPYEVGTGEEEGLVDAQGCMVCTSATWDNGALILDRSARCIAPGSELTVRTDRAVLTVTVIGIRQY